jgi:conjugative transfer signal peptidase TraF
MTRRWLLLGVCAIACLGLARGAGAPALMWNATASIPIGLYRLAPSEGLAVGDVVVFDPPIEIAMLLDRRGWLPFGVPLVKPVAAVSGQLICRQGEKVDIDGAVTVRARQRDAHGAPLPTWSGCHRLAADEVFVISQARGSFDGRYLGPTPRQAVKAVARPVWLPQQSEVRR